MNRIDFILLYGFALFVYLIPSSNESLTYLIEKRDVIFGNSNTNSLNGYLDFIIDPPQKNQHLISDQKTYILPSEAFRMSWELWIIIIAILLTGTYVWWRKLRQQIQDERIINYFATSLYGQNTVEDVFWDIAKNCISQLDFEDCVIYFYDPARRILIQKAAFGPKNPVRHEILNPITIPLGEGITGYSALHGHYVLVADTTKDSRYITDDQARCSELAVPIMIEGKVFGVIDTEHSEKNFYTQRHVRILEKIAGLCNQKLSRYLTEERIRSAIARDLHDEIGSTLTSINILSKIAIEQNNQEKVYDYLGRIRENSRLMMDAMSDMVWTINPENDSILKMVVRLKEFASEILDPAGISYAFSADETVLETKLPLDSRKDLYLILKEAITNAAKYSQAKEVTVTFAHDHQHAAIMIKDDGTGMKLNGESNGNGLKNMAHRARSINAQLTIDSKPGQGTMVRIELPIT